MDRLDRYMKELSAALNCPKILRRQLLDQTRRMAEDFRAGKPDATWEDIRSYLGEPEELARTMLECENQEALGRYRKHKRLWKRAAVAFLLLALVLVSCALVYVYRFKTKPLIVEVTERVVIERGRSSSVELPD